ncbi:MAG: DUF2235 domain-containing protein [Rhodospirillales bacterium]
MPGKNIVLLSDGTGNSAARQQKSNVWRLYQALDLRGTDQVAMYDDGVGTSTNRYLAILGGAFGFGLKRNVLRLYTYLCRNYRPGDEVFGFGFSRGAFTIRLLAGLVLRQGLVTYTTEEDLRYKVKEAYRAYRSAGFQGPDPKLPGSKRTDQTFKQRAAAAWRSEKRRTAWPALIGRRLRDLILKFWHKLRGRDPYVANEVRVETIRFLGVWDTVDAYGLPVDEMKEGIDRFIWPLTFDNRILSPRVRRACHALALDDERTTFHPVLWNEVEERRMVQNGEVAGDRLSQVWFAGTHANVGGGYADDRLAHVPLLWMIAEAEKTGLRFTPQAVANLAIAASPFGKLYDSRAGFAGYYRYGPRQTYMGDPAILPMIHESAVTRMADGTDHYAPIALTRRFVVLTPTGVVPGNTYLPALTAPPHRRQPSRPKRAAIRQAWDVVWWRRVAYFTIIAISVGLVAFPLFTAGDGPTAGDERCGGGGNWVLAVLGGIRCAELAVSAMLRSVLSVVGLLVPAYTDYWIDAYAQRPLLFLTLAATLLAAWLWSADLQGRVHDRVRAAWKLGQAGGMKAWTRTSVRRRMNLAVVLFVFAVMGLANWPELADALSPVLGQALSNVTFGFPILMVLVVPLWAWSFWRAAAPGGESGRSEWGRRAARFLRTNPISVALHGFFVRWVLPVFGAGLVVLAALLLCFLANRLIVNATTASGLTCSGSGKTSSAVTEQPRHITFDTGNPCQQTGWALKRGETYRIDIAVKEPWRDGTLAEQGVKIGPAGFDTPSGNVRMWLGMLMRRHLSEKWFVPIARIGRLGMDEYPLGPHSTLLTARGDGELFLYVNDAALINPRLVTLFYDNNKGSATVTIRKVDEPVRR